jgi:hypothetical protein
MDSINKKLIHRDNNPFVIPASATTGYKKIGTVFFRGLAYNGCRFTLDIAGLYSHMDTRNKQINFHFNVNLYPNATNNGIMVDCEYDERQSKSFSDDTNIDLDTDFIHFIVTDLSNSHYKVDIYIKNNPTTVIGYSINHIVWSGYANFEIGKDLGTVNALPANSGTVSLDVNVFPYRARNIISSPVPNVTPASGQTLTTNTFLFYVPVPANLINDELKFIAPAVFGDYSVGWAMVGVSSSGSLTIRMLGSTQTSIIKLYLDSVRYYYN